MLKKCKLTTKNYGGGVLLLVFSAMLMISSCAQTASSNYSNVNLNAAEQKIAGKTFSNGKESYAFYSDKTGNMTPTTSKNMRAISAGKFTWTAQQAQNGNINITMKQNNQSTTATYSVNNGQSRLEVSGQGSFSEVVDAVVAEINLVRANPADYAEKYLKPRLSNFTGNNYKEGNVTVITQEGEKAVQEAIDYMSKISTLPALTIEQGLRLSSKDHANWLAANGKMGHDGENGSTPATRIAKYGNANGPKENINYGVDRADARKIVIQQLIDDGTTDRAHRNTILDGGLKFAGSYTTKYSKMPSGIAYGDGDDVNVCVINFASSYQIKAEYAGEQVTGSLSDVASSSSGGGGGIVAGGNELVGTLWYCAPSGLKWALYFKSSTEVVTAACNSEDQAEEAVLGTNHVNGAVTTTYTYDESTKKGHINDFPKHDRYPDSKVEGSNIVIPGLWHSQGDFTYNDSGNKTLSVKCTTIPLSATSWTFVKKVN